MRDGEDERVVMKEWGGSEKGDVFDVTQNAALKCLFSVIEIEFYQRAFIENVSRTSEPYTARALMPPARLASDPHGTCHHEKRAAVPAHAMLVLWFASRMMAAAPQWCRR
jgi:hypothetical protein